MDFIILGTAFIMPVIYGFGILLSLVTGTTPNLTDTCD